MLFGVFAITDLSLPLPVKLVCLLFVPQVGSIVTVEHNPVYTLGRREKEDATLTASLSRLGAAVIKVWRWH